jgi:hypothetical protein
MGLWKANAEVHKQVLDLIANNHPDLALISDEIVVIFREKAGKSGGQVILGRPKRASALANVLSGEDFKFILEIGADTWEHELSALQREALLDHLLCGCTAEEDPKTGDPKLGLRAPDITAYRENIERYGMWFPKDPDDDDTPSPVEEMFGDAK